MVERIESRSILQPYIKEGKVNYSKLKNDEDLFHLINYFQTTDPEGLSRDERLAFWMNAYNIITLKAVLEKLEKDPKWEGVTSFWRKFKFFFWNKHEVAQQKMSLYHLENKILREKFKEPRIHFAINCASNSCPYLPDKLFDHENLDEQLDHLTKDFINHQEGVIVEENRIYLSEIFKMYTEDFGGKGNLIDYVSKYWNGDAIPKDGEIKFQDYDWRLNNQ